MSNIKYPIILNSMIILLLAGSCKSGEKTEESAPDKKEITSVTLSGDQISMMHIESMQLQERSVDQIISAYGKVILLANSKAEISSLFRGRVERILATEGQFVKKGQVLLEMEVPDLINVQQQYMEAKSELQFLSLEMQRQKTLVAENAGSLKNMQDVQSKYMKQMSILKGAEARLKMAGISGTELQNIESQSFRDLIQITSPINGYIDHYPVSLGTSVTEGMPLAKINNLDDLHADISIFEKDIQQVKEGQLADLTFSDPSLPAIQGKVEFVGREVDKLTRTVMLHVKFEPPVGAMILPDMQVKAGIHSGSTIGLALPDAAVLKENDKTYYFRSDATAKASTTFHKVYFTSSGRGEGYYIIPPLPDSDNFVVTHGAGILEGEMKKDEMGE